LIDRPGHDVKLPTQLRTHYELIMHFQLPSHLQQELLAYDPKLKALIKEQEPKKTTKKAKYPLGNIPHLIPETVVRNSLQQDAIDRINGELAPGRFHSFTKVVDVATPQARTVPFAIIYHFEQCWYAAWLPQRGEDYLYGYAYAFKNTAAAAKTVPHQIWNSKEQCTEHTTGRGVQIFTYTRTITKQDIIAGADRRNWRAMGVASYYQKSREMHEAVTQFEQELMSTIPTWSDSRSIFGRIKCSNLLDALEFPSVLTNCIEDRSAFKLTVDGMVNLANRWMASNKYIATTYVTIQKIEHIITAPSIKKQLQLMLDKSVAEYNNPLNNQRKAVKYGYKEFEQITNSIYFINRVWPDCPLDHYRTYFEELRVVNLNHLRTNDTLLAWLREHMSVTSFLNMMRKHVEKSNEEHCRISSLSDHDFIIHAWYEMNDTFSMMMRVFENDKTIEAPKRWRMPDFHDYVQAEAWKIQHKNESLHQDLFPEPVKVTMGEEDWTFIQPINTHQLAQWGQAVRNCVGSASQYAEDIKKRKHFIVLCMIDGKPTFTIQLDVSMGVMNVKQIAGVGNQRLDDEAREQYSHAFKLALQSRESELSSKS
jgi:hypothetical protein